MQELIKEVNFSKDTLMQMEEEELRELALTISENAHWKSREAQAWFEFKIVQMQMKTVTNRARR